MKLDKIKLPRKLWRPFLFIWQLTRVEFLQNLIKSKNLKILPLSTLLLQARIQYPYSTENCIMIQLCSPALTNLMSLSYKNVTALVLEGSKPAPPFNTGIQRPSSESYIFYLT